MIRKVFDSYFSILPISFYMIYIFNLSSGPAPKEFLLVPDWLSHMIGYLIFFILSFLASRVIFRKQSQKFISISSAGFSLFYSLTDEFHQSFIPCRDASLWDISWDFIGIFIGLVFLLIYSANANKEFNP